MQKREFLKTLGLAAFGGAVGAVSTKSNNRAVAGVSTWEKIMSRGTLRAGYIVLAPEMSKDPNTGQLSGIAYDLTMALGQKLNLRIEWVEELNFASMHEGLAIGRFDMVCFTLYRRANSGRVMNFSRPLFYSGNGIFVRANDRRLINDVQKLNNSDIKIGTIDGEVSSELAGEYFPLARTVTLPSGTDLAQLLMHVITRKTDAALINRAAARFFMTKNPGLLVDLAERNPICLYSHGFGLPKDQYDLQQAIDLAFDELLENGKIERVLQKFEPFSGAYLRAAMPYQPHV